MRKNYLFAAALCAVVLAGCSQDEHLSFVNDEKSNFTGVLETLNSRTSLGENNKVVWAEGDEVSIFEGDNANSLYRVNGITDGIANFEYVDYTDPTKWEDLNPVANYAVYPYSENNSIAVDGTISVLVPTEYTFKDKASSVEKAFMAAKSTTTQLNFINTQGVIRLRLNAKKPTKYGKIQSITLTSDNNNLTGTATISFAGTTTPSAVITGTDAGKVLTINLDESIKDELPLSTSGEYTEFYVPVVPTDFAAEDLTLTVVGDKDTYTYVIKPAFSIGRKVIKGIKHTLGDSSYSGGIDGETTEAWDGETTTEVTPNNGVYTITKASELAWMSARALTGNNGIAETVTIDLQKDIDMGGFEFSSIIAQRGDKLIFQGNNHSISNIKIISGADDNTTGQASMFYCYPNSTLEVSDLTLEGVTVTSEENGTGYAAAVVGFCEGTAIFNNVDVVNATVTGVKSSGLLVGHLSGSLNATGCDLSGTVSLSSYSGEAAGHYAGKYVGTIAGAATLTNCTVNATVSGALHADNVGDIYGRMTVDGSLTVNGMTYVATTAQLTAVVSAGVTDIYLMDGEYDIDGCGGKTFTINGSRNAIIKVVGVGHGEANGQLDYGLDGSNVTFKGVTIQTNGQTYAGYARLNATYIDCHIENCYCLNGKSVFENCEFSQSGDQYNIWTWGAKEATFTKCTFNCDGKSILVYNQNLTVTFDTCTFNDNGDISGKAAIETGVDNGNTQYTINITSCIFNGFDTTTQNAVTYGGTNLGTNAWGNKNLITAENLNVTIDGNDVY